MERDGLVYLNTAACGLIPSHIRQAGIELYNGFTANSSAASEYWRDKQYAAVKKNTADFLQAEESQVAFIPNFSFALNAIVHSLKGTEKVLLYRRDYPSVHIPFIINRFDIYWIEDEDGFFIDIDKIADIIKKEKIDIVAISQVQWQSGFKLNLTLLGTICKEYGTILIADATQSLGAMTIDLSSLPVDVLIASNYKWMNAGFGTGILWMNKEFLERYPPKVSGNASRTFLSDNDRYIYSAAVTDYEPGSLDMFGYTIMDSSIKEKNEAGIQHIETHNLSLTQKMLDGIAGFPLTVKGGYNIKDRSSIVCLEEKPGLHAFLLKDKIITTLRNGLIRISAHYYNTENDIDSLLSSLRHYCGKH